MECQPQQPALIEEGAQIRKQIRNIQERGWQQSAVLYDSDLAGLFHDEQSPRTVAGVRDRQRRDQARSDGFELDDDVPLRNAPECCGGLGSCGQARQGHKNGGEC